MVFCVGKRPKKIRKHLSVLSYLNFEFGLWQIVQNMHQLDMLYIGFAHLHGLHFNPRTCVGTTYIYHILTDGSIISTHALVWFAITRYYAVVSY